MTVEYAPTPPRLRGYGYLFGVLSTPCRRAAADAIHADYVARRARHIKGDSAAGVLALVREWFGSSPTAGR